MEQPEKTGIIRNEKGQFVPGESGNPAGKPKGIVSPITRLRQIWEDNPDDFEKFVNEYKNDPLSRKHIVEMLDGKPKQTIAGDNQNPLTIKVVKYGNSDTISLPPEDLPTATP